MSAKTVGVFERTETGTHKKANSSETFFIGMRLVDTNGGGPLTNSDSREIVVIAKEHQELVEE